MGKRRLQKSFDFWKISRVLLAKRKAPSSRVLLGYDVSLYLLQENYMSQIQQEKAQFLLQQGLHYIKSDFSAIVLGVNSFNPTYEKLYKNIKNNGTDH